MKNPRVKTILILCLLLAASIVLEGCTKKGSQDDNDDTLGPTLSYTEHSAIKVVHMEGWVNNETDEMEKLRFFITLHAPDPESKSNIKGIDIKQELWIHLSWNDKEPGTDGEAGVIDLIHQNNTNDESDYDERFTHTIVHEPHNSMADAGLLEQDSQITIDIDFTLFSIEMIPTGNGLDPSSSGVAKFILHNGMFPVLKWFGVLHIFPSEGGWIELY